MSSNATESAGLFEFLAWIEVNKKRLVIGATAVAIIGFGIWFYRLKAAQTEEAATAALLQLNPAAAGSAAQPSASSSDFLQIANAYAGTAAGEHALYLAAGAQFAEGKYTDAKATFERFLREHDGSSLAPGASFGVAACLDALDQASEAAAKYQELIARFRDTAEAGQAKLALARIDEAQKHPEQALQIYDEMTRSNVTANAWSSAAGMKREELLQKYPQLATNSTKVTVSAPALAPATTNAPAKSK